MLATARRLVDTTAVVVLLALLACVVLGVVTRAFNAPLAWTDEMAQYLLVWMGCLGWMIASRRRSHIRINVFIDKLPRKARLATEVVIQCIVIVLALALLRYVPSVIQRNLDVEWVSLPISAALLYIPVPIAAMSLMFHAVAEMKDALNGYLTPPPAPGVLPL